MTKEERNKLIIYKYEVEKKSYKQIANELGMSKSGIGYILKNECSNINTNRNISDYDIRKYKCNDDYFETIDNEHKAYWLGFMYADGYNNQDKNNFSLCLKEDDIESLEQFKKDLSYNGKILVHKVHYRRLFISSKKLSNDLSKCGCIQNKTFYITFPDESILPIELRNHFIRGYFDGDGSIWFDKSKNNYKGQFVGTFDFLTSINNIIDIGNRKVRKANNRNNGIYRLDYGGNLNMLKLKDYLYKDATIYMKRKYNRFKELENMYK